MGSFELRLLGVASLIGPDGAEVPLRPLSLRVLSALALRGRTAATTDWLLEQLWPDGAPSTALKSLQNAVAEIRREGDRTLITTVTGGYRLDGMIDVDRWAIAEIAAACERLAEGSADDVIGFAAEAERAWRGRPYQALESSVDAVADGAAAESELRSILTRRAEVLAERQPDVAVRQTAELLEQDPWDERLWAVRAAALYRSARRADSLRELERAREVLAEAGLTVGPELLDLEQRILSDELTSASSSTVGPTTAMRTAEEHEAAQRRRELVRAIGTHAATGRLTPILGHGLLVGERQSRSDIARRWAAEFEFPMEPYRSTALPDVAQYVAAMTNADTVQLMFQRQLGKSPTGGTDDPHATIAALPCAVFVSATPTYGLVDALRARGKDPVIEHCAWREPDGPVERDLSRERPSTDRPLVFYPFGCVEEPRSLVLSQDDYMEFVVRVSQVPALIPGVVRRALADSALLMLGFDLDDWDARTLLRTLVDQEGSSRLGRYTHVAAQVDPSNDVVSEARAVRYLERYFARARRPSIDIFWGSVRDFCAELASSGVLDEAAP